MLFVDNGNITDPRLNLAIEEHLLRNVQAEEPILLFYVNEPAVIIGRNQNTLQEIDPDYITANDIHVVRRLSGGGAVYHDLGNLNFSFVTPGREHLHNFARFTEPVVAVLRRLGVEAELQGKSDIFAGGKKISGNAQYATAGRMFSHGTLLFDTDLEHMLKALNPRQAHIESKAVQSVRNFVANIRELLAEAMDIHQLKQALLAGVFGPGEIPTYDLAETDWQEIRRLSAERYAQWEWNYGRSPRFNVQKSEAFPAGKIEARIDVAGGRVQGIKFYGNFSGRRDVAELEALLVGVPYDREALAAALEGLDVGAYFGDLPPAALLNLLF
ncbi:MAG: lipoate--protein ligase [Chloroflexi bacterium]|nr:lipoate--protein ligase [Chloroflexota bacterium]MCI0577364.1 lipoate--protein ligase [Chloroflexota bacterium]MCI0647051.1 lipoate--protein ligase [Chloroflexota bacterium]MCI0731538.1 lipoate--protein ligase [Chloroflexota bacterium]